MLKIITNKAVMFAVFSLAVIVGIYQYFIYGFDHLFEPDAIRIEFEENKKMMLKIDVVKGCTHEIGIGFLSKENATNNNAAINIANFFGPPLELNLPAEIYMEIFNSNDNIILKQDSFGGKKLHYRYGPNPIKFIAGTVYLEAGHYDVILKVIKLHKNFQSFEAFFFATHIPKTECGN